MRGVCRLIVLTITVDIVNQTVGGQLPRLTTIIDITDMNESTNDADTKIVLPIICPGCGNEINLAVDFSLLSPTTPADDSAAIAEDFHESEEA